MEEAHYLKEYIALIVSPALFVLAFWFVKNYFKEHKEALATMEKNMSNFIAFITKKVEEMSKENKDISRVTNEKLHTMSMDIVSIKRAINEEILGMKERLLELSKNPAVTSNEKLERFINVYKENTGKLIEFMESAKQNFGKVTVLEETSQRHEELIMKMFKVATANHDQFVAIKGVLDLITKKKESAKS